MNLTRCKGAVESWVGGTSTSGGKRRRSGGILGGCQDIMCWYTEELALLGNLHLYLYLYIHFRVLLFDRVIPISSVLMYTCTWWAELVCIKTCPKNTPLLWATLTGQWQWQLSKRSKLTQNSRVWCQNKGTSGANPVQPPASSGMRHYPLSWSGNVNLYATQQWWSRLRVVTSAQEPTTTEYDTVRLR